MNSVCCDVRPGDTGAPRDVLHGLNEADARQEQVAVKLQDFHGLHHVVLSDDVLHADPRPFIFPRSQVIGNLLPRFLSELSFCRQQW